MRLNYDYLIKTKLINVKKEILTIERYLQSDKLIYLDNEINNILDYFDKLMKDIKESEIE